MNKVLCLTFVFVMLVGLGFQNAPNPVKDLPTIFVSEAGDTELEHIHITLNFVPDVKLGDSLVYRGQEFVVYSMRVPLGDKVVIQVDASRTLESYTKRLAQLQANPSKFKLVANKAEK